MFTSQATIARRAAKEARLQAIEKSLEANEKVKEVLTGIEARLTALESKGVDQEQTQTLSKFEDRLTIVEAKGSNDELQQSVTKFEERLIALDTKVSNKEEQTILLQTVSDLSGQVGKYIQQCDTCVEKQVSIQGKYDELQKTVESLQQELVELRKVKQSNTNVNAKPFATSQKKSTTE